MYKSEVLGKGGIRARVVTDSISTIGSRITTMELCYHRFIHSEFMTHRLFSRNASSSRAIPINKMIEQVTSNPATPVHWGKNKPGMQAYEELEDASYLWCDYARLAAEAASELSLKGYHKQIVNRLLEPFQFINVVVTATEWENFFLLRDHKDAQPEIRELARCMKEALRLSVPSELQYGEWHLPYVQMQYSDMGQTSLNNESLEECIKMSAARCARVSYLTHNKSSPSIEEDLELYNQLVTRPYTDKRGNVLGGNDPIHASPLEHQATPMKVSKWPEYSDPSIWLNSEEKGVTHADREGCYWSGNFKNWIQYRQLIQGN